MTPGALCGLQREARLPMLNNGLLMSLHTHVTFILMSVLIFVKKYILVFTLFYFQVDRFN